MLKNNPDNPPPANDNSFFHTLSLGAAFDAAAKSEQLNILEQMLVDGIDINEKDSTGRTLLHWAVEHNHVDAVKLLLASGADATIPDKKGNTAPLLAKKKHYLKIQYLFTDQQNGRKN